MSDKLKIYTDGACSGNPGIGGWGAVLINPDTGEEKHLSGAENLTTNNKKFEKLMKGYCSLRNLSPKELFYLPLLCQAAAMRFLLTRLYDWVHTPKSASVVPKNPNEYIIKLRHHKQIVINQNYNKIPK